MIAALIHSMVVCPDMEKTYPKISHGEGSYLYDESGKRYLDASSGSAAVSNIGHGNAAIADILKDQALKASVLPTHAFSASVVENYLEKLVRFAPKGFKRAWTVTSGTEAVENAIKIALQYQQMTGRDKKHKVVSRWFSYHGNSIFTLDVGGMRFRRKMYEQWMHNFPHISPAYQYRNGDGMSEEDYCDQCINEFLEVIQKNDPDTIAAYIAEPVVGAALGAVPPPKDYFKRIKEICEAYDILFISDEVMTGFGRLGTPFGIEKFDVIPDIIAAGKGISGGYFPLSAVLIHNRIASVFESQMTTFKAGHTFACNPMGAAVGNYVLDFIEARNILANVNEQGALLRERLNELKTLDIVGDIRGEGLLLGIELVSDKLTKEPFPANKDVSKRIFLNALERGVILYPGKGSADGINGDHILVCPPLSINKEEVEFLANTIRESIVLVQEELHQLIL
ncbi:aminotransferase class III-fold pyridoxal phosphate-dependent enzyme [Aureisphaera galaxeae]|uniref:aminotransferase family protein n=1 Tax=Aureisphaera galaxeae TaxID=1538023 RepID=UPI002350AE95|nr:aminotransferase class III-fold pyridoxal phosphate-dependent enzyme [Aureisphaera galaxeae]MDC8004724.1 aminotransferase class III-fold pyridoxal phosphate-dependent enzyme [Aureisphaera galaxeae]